MADGEAPAVKKNADLPVRAASAVVMVAVAGVALWLGGWFWAAFVALIAIGVFYEWSKLAFGITASNAGRIIWIAAGLIYIGFACSVLIYIRPEQVPNGYSTQNRGLMLTAVILTSVVAVDVGAYFFGRAIGGPKIAPKISPSKTWAGLFGGCIGIFFVLLVHLYWSVLTSYGDSRFYGREFWSLLPSYILLSIVVATVAQAGDFFESWMKRASGVKDSGNILPGHGGLFDRVDGLLAVCVVHGMFNPPAFWYIWP